MTISIFCKPTYIYGNCGVFDYDFKQYSTISFDLFFNTISAPIYTTISDNVIISISGTIVNDENVYYNNKPYVVYNTISSVINNYNTISGILVTTQETIYYTISSIAYNTISSIFYNTSSDIVDSTICVLDASNNKLYYNYIDQNIINEITWYNYGRTNYTDVLSYINKDIYHKQIY